MNKAVFLDRDGVLNRLVLNPKTGKYESPHRVRDFRLYPGTLPLLRKLRGLKYRLFLISNQPSYAKGKTPLEEIRAIQDELHRQVKAAKIRFMDYFYCYHHPDGVVPEYVRKCECRKPEPYFILYAAEKYRIDLKYSWLIGDRDSDIMCGQRAGVRTILINKNGSVKKRGNRAPDFVAPDLKGAVEILLSNS